MPQKPLWLKGIEHYVVINIKKESQSKEDGKYKKNPMDLLLIGKKSYDLTEPCQKYDS